MLLALNAIQKPNHLLLGHDPSVKNQGTGAICQTFGNGRNCVHIMLRWSCIFMMWFS